MAGKPYEGLWVFKKTVAKALGGGVWVLIGRNIAILYTRLCYNYYIRSATMQTDQLACHSNYRMNIMTKILTPVLNTDMDKIVYIPTDNRLVSRYLSKHKTLDITTIRDDDYKRVLCLTGLKEDRTRTNSNRDFFVGWAKKQPIEGVGKLNDEGLALLHDNMMFDGDCLADIMINIESSLSRWRADAAEKLAVEYQLDTKGMDESDIQTAVINHIHDNYEAVFEGVISEGDDYLIVHSEAAGRLARPLK